MSEHYIVGNLTADPELRYTQNGLAVVNVTIAEDKQKWDKDANKFVDAPDKLFLRGSAWRDHAEHINQTLKKGMRVVAVGELVQRSFETPEGQKRTVTELAIKEIGPGTRWATAVVTKAAGGGAGGGFGQPQQAVDQNGWATSQPQQGGFPNAPQENVWGAPGSSYSDETPF